MTEKGGGAAVPPPPVAGPFRNSKHRGSADAQKVSRFG